MTTQVVSVGMDDKLETVQVLFERFRFHHLLVLDEDGILVEVVSDRDLLKALSPFISTLAERSQDLRTLKKPVHQIMGRRPITASKDLTIKEAAVLISCCFLHPLQRLCHALESIPLVPVIRTLRSARCCFHAMFCLLNAR